MNVEDELIKLCDDYLNSRNFAKKVMFTQEVKANNNVEGIKDEITQYQKRIDIEKNSINI